MDLMMMAIIAIVVLVLIAGGFFFMKSRGGSANSRTDSANSFANRPKTLAEQQREMAQQRLNSPIPPSEPVVDPLDTAQQYIQHQNFQQATTVLKEAIQKDAQRSALYLPLLNIFAQQKNLTEFNHYLNPLLALNDTDATTQAMSLKRLLDDEIVFETNHLQPAPVVSQPVSNQALPAASTQSESLDFDGFDFNETPSAPVMSTGSSVSHEVADDLDFNFDDTAIDTKAVVGSAPTVLTSTATPALVDDFAFEFDAPTTASVSTPVALTNAVSNDDEIFNLEVLENEALNLSEPTPPAAAVVTLTATPTAEVANEDFDFNFDETPTLPQVTPISASGTVPVIVTASDSFEMDDFNFDLAQIQPESSASPTLAPSATIEATSDTPVTLVNDSDDMVFGITQESRSAIVHTIASAETVKQDTTQADSDAFNLDFDDFNIESAPNNTPMAEIVTQMPVVDSSLDLPIENSVTVAQISDTKQPADEYDTFNQLDNLYAASNSPVTDNTLVVNEPITGTPLTTSPVTMNEDFLSIVNGLDTAQLNLDLAIQYVQLGEYDSAKRLLAEINSANPQQQQQITGLLDKIG